MSGPGKTQLDTINIPYWTAIAEEEQVRETVPWAKDLFATIRDKLSPLDPSLDVLPAHYTSRLESQADGTLRRNLGDLLENDPVASMTDEDEFLAYVVDHLGESPGEYSTIRLVNLGIK